MKPSDILEWVPMPPEWKEALKNATTLWRSIITIICLGFMFHIAWACGWLEDLGLMRLANAEDVDRQINNKLKPVVAKVDELDKKIDHVSSQQEVQAKRLAQSLKFDYDERIRGAIRAWCHAPSDDHTERARIRHNISDMEDAYKEVTGEKYDEPSCDQV